MRQATFLNYNEQSFTDWNEKTGATFGYIAVDPIEDTLLKSWDWEPYNVDLFQAEKDLNELGYTIGIEAIG